MLYLINKQTNSKQKHSKIKFWIKNIFSPFDFKRNENMLGMMVHAFKFSPRNAEARKSLSF